MLVLLRPVISAGRNRKLFLNVIRPFYNARRPFPNGKRSFYNARRPFPNGKRPFHNLSMLSALGLGLFKDKII